MIYVELYEEKPMEQEVESDSGIKLEIRELNVRKDYPLLVSESMLNHLDVLSVLGNVYTYIEGNEWERDSAEIDEDRKVYVLYVTSTGYTMES